MRPPPTTQYALWTFPSSPPAARPHQPGRPAVGGAARERFGGNAAGSLEARLEHEVFGRIAGDEQLREHHEVGALGSRLRARVPRLLGVTGDIADDRIELGKRDREPVARAVVHG